MASPDKDASLLVLGNYVRILLDHTDSENPYEQPTVLECARGDLACITEVSKGGQHLTVKILRTGKVINVSDDVVQPLSPLESLALQAE